MDVYTFVQNVKLLCASRGISPTAACKESGVGTSFIPDIKRGRIPSIDKFEKLALYLGVTISELLGERKVDLAVACYNVPPKDTIEEVFEVVECMKPRVLSDFKRYVEVSNPPLSSQSSGPYSFILEAKLQSYASIPLNDVSPIESNKNEQVELSSDELSLINSIRKLSSSQKSTVSEIIYAFANKNE